MSYGVYSSTQAYPSPLCGSFPFVSDYGTVLSGEGVVASWTVLGKESTNGKLRVCKSANTDGSQNPFAIIAEGVDATSADSKCYIFLTGEFFADKLVYGTGITASAIKDALRDLGIYLR
jgi:hypothetical protein